MAETVGFQISGINNQITDDFGTQNDLEVTGGGRGWTATTTRRDGQIVTAKGTSKLGAAEALYETFKAGLEDETDDLPEGFETGDMDEGEIAQCVAECVDSTSAFCRCKCQTVNHGAGLGDKRPVVTLLGQKLCKCGCGESTNRVFVPGHDARFHGLQKLVQWGEAKGILSGFGQYTEDDLEGARKAKVAEQRKAARERRATKRAAEAAAADKAAKKAAKLAASVK